ncbi:hypothetical protein OH77DRAFT_98782 [Trametes cingulata]|nr:hypothetical protein OH77DRAFT_98782 [Trametes cingulata]
MESRSTRSAARPTGAGEGTSEREPPSLTTDSCCTAEMMGDEQSKGSCCVQKACIMNARRKTPGIQRTLRPPLDAAGTTVSKKFLAHPNAEAILELSNQISPSRHLPIRNEGTGLHRCRRGPTVPPRGSCWRKYSTLAFRSEWETQKTRKIRTGSRPALPTYARYLALREAL